MVLLVSDPPALLLLALEPPPAVPVGDDFAVSVFLPVPGSVAVPLCVSEGDEGVLPDGSEGLLLPPEPEFPSEGVPLAGLLPLPDDDEGGLDGTKGRLGREGREGIESKGEEELLPPEDGAVESEPLLPAPGTRLDPAPKMTVERQSRISVVVSLIASSDEFVL